MLQLHTSSTKSGNYVHVSAIQPQSNQALHPSQVAEHGAGDKGGKHKDRRDSFGLAGIHSSLL